MATEVYPESLIAAGNACRGLGDAIRGLSDSGDRVLVHELTKQLICMSKSISWQLRTDRDKYESVD